MIAVTKTSKLKSMLSKSVIFPPNGFASLENMAFLKKPCATLKHAIIRYFFRERVKHPSVNLSKPFAVKREKTLKTA